MAIAYKFGNLLDVTSGHIVHGCNSHGVMGSGVAAAIKAKWPVAFKDYRQIYETRGLKVGQVFPVEISDGLILWNAITQENFGQGIRHVSYDGLTEAFEQINSIVLSTDSVPKEIHIPAIGAGLGGGKWKIIEAIISETVNVPVTVWLYGNTI